MDIEKFQKLAAEAADEYEIDNLCWDWLEAAAKDNGKEGKIGLELLQLVKRQCMP